MKATASPDAHWIARQIARIRSHPLVATMVVTVSLVAAVLALPSQIHQALQGLSQIGPIKKMITERREAALAREREKLLCPALSNIEGAPRCPVQAQWISFGEAGVAAVVPDWRDENHRTIYLFGFKDGRQLYGTDLGFQSPGAQVWAKTVAGVPWFIVHNIEGSCEDFGFDIFTISKLGSLKKAKVIDPAYGPLPADLRTVNYNRGEPVLIGCRRHLRAINGEWIVFAPHEIYRLRLADRAVTADTLDPQEEIYAGSDTSLFLVDEQGRVTLDGVQHDKVVRVRGVRHTYVAYDRRKLVIKRPDGRLWIFPADGSSSQRYWEQNSVFSFTPGRWFLWFDAPSGTHRVLLEVKP